MKARPVSFAYLLPLAQLSLWILLVPTQTLYYLAFSHADRFLADPSAGNYFKFVVRIVAEKYGHLFTALDLPGGLIQVLIDLPTRWPNEWQPNGLTLWSWRAISFPIFGLPFWWFAGRGLDGALGIRRLHLTSLVIGAVMTGLMITALLGFAFGLPASDRTSDRNWIFEGVGLWTIAFGLFPFTWIRMGIQKRRDNKVLKLKAE